jgi:hypothetical protein
MKTLLMAAALAIAGGVTVQAAEIFTCSGLGYANHNGKIERARTALVTTHWTKLGEHFVGLLHQRARRLPRSANHPAGRDGEGGGFAVRNDLGGGTVDRGFHFARRGRGAGADRAQQRWRPPGYRGGSHHRFCSDSGRRSRGAGPRGRKPLPADLAAHVHNVRQVMPEEGIMCLDNGMYWPASRSFTKIY